MCRPKASSLDEWQVFVAEAIRRYGKNGDFWNQSDNPYAQAGAFDVKAFEVWNEPNLAQFWDGTTEPQVDAATEPERDAREYVDLLDAANVGRNVVYVYAHKPKTPLLAPSWTRSSPASEADRWLTTFGQGADPASYNSQSIHPYGSITQTREKIGIMRAKLPAKPMWITEHGFGAGTNGSYHGGPGGTTAEREDQQRRLFEETINELDANHPYVASYTWFSGVDWYDDNTQLSLSKPYARFGLFRLDEAGSDTEPPVYSERTGLLNAFKREAAAE